MQERIIKGDLIIKNKNYSFKGNLTVEGTVIINNGNLIVHGKLCVWSLKDFVQVTNANIYAKSITTDVDIIIKNGTICAFEDLVTLDIISEDADIIVGGNSLVRNVSCRNYLVDGLNYSEDIRASESVYILGTSRSQTITSPEIFIGDDSNFYGSCVISNHFETGGHVRNCLRRYFL